MLARANSNLPHQTRGAKRDTQTRRQQGYLVSLLLFFQNKESRLKIYFLVPD
jgi:hypothetical protein